ncbi:transmembrane [Cystoisospora suis]|uniref:Transmembrane n=1 Tax=Cystoisospora suis TaxID=483139 RepID=A0A2C6KTA9_9APIC|nr:transmembrane [Cystoisospora suis]
MRLFSYGNLKILSRLCCVISLFLSPVFSLSCLSPSFLSFLLSLFVFFCSLFFLSFFKFIILFSFLSSIMSFAFSQHLKTSPQESFSPSSSSQRGSSAYPLHSLHSHYPSPYRSSSFFTTSSSVATADAAYVEDCRHLQDSLQQLRRFSSSIRRLKKQCFSLLSSSSSSSSSLSNTPPKEDSRDGSSLFPSSSFAVSAYPQRQLGEQLQAAREKVVISQHLLQNLSGHASAASTAGERTQRLTMKERFMRSLHIATGDLMEAAEGAEDVLHAFQRKQQLSSQNKDALHVKDARVDQEKEQRHLLRDAKQGGKVSSSSSFSSSAPPSSSSSHQVPQQAGISSSSFAGSGDFEDVVNQQKQRAELLQLLQDHQTRGRHHQLDKRHLSRTALAARELAILDSERHSRGREESEETVSHRHLPSRNFSEKTSYQEEGEEEHDDTSLPGREGSGSSDIGNYATESRKGAALAAAAGVSAESVHTDEEREKERCLTTLPRAVREAVGGEVDLEEAIRKEQRDGLQRIHEEIQGIHYLYEQLASYVSDQQKGIDAASDLLCASCDRTDQATLEIQLASDYQRTATRRRRCFCISLFAIVALILWISVYVLPHF